MLRFQLLGFNQLPRSRHLSRRAVLQDISASSRLWNRTTYKQSHSNLWRLPTSAYLPLNLSRYCIPIHQLTQLWSKKVSAKRTLQMWMINAVKKKKCVVKPNTLVVVLSINSNRQCLTLLKASFLPQHRTINNRLRCLFYMKKWYKSLRKTSDSILLLRTSFVFISRTLPTRPRSLRHRIARISLHSKKRWILSNEKSAD